MPQFSVFSILLLFMAGICVLIAAGQFFLARTGSKKYFWAIAYFLVGSLMFYGAIVHSSLLMQYPHFYGPHIGLSFFPAVFFFAYFRRWLYPDEKLNLSFHLIPGLVAMAITLPFMLSDAETKQTAVFAYYKHGMLSWREHLFIIGLFSNVVYANWLAWEARILYRNIHVHGRSIFSLTALCAILSSISVLTVILAYYLNNREIERFGLIGLMVAACCGYFFMQRASHLSDEMQKSIAENRYRKSRLSGMDTQAIRVKLENAMLREKIFTDFELTMPKLAEKIGLKPHQLSEYLNVIEKSKFNEYLNRHRIDEAKRILASEPDLNVLNIGFKAGFNSKSAFNLIFRKQTGVSPSEYRRQMPKNGEIPGVLTGISQGRR